MIRDRAGLGVCSPGTAKLFPTSPGTDRTRSRARRNKPSSPRTSPRSGRDPGSRRRCLRNVPGCSCARIEVPGPAPAKAGVRAETIVEISFLRRADRWVRVQTLPSAAEHMGAVAASSLSPTVFSIRGRTRRSAPTTHYAPRTTHQVPGITHQALPQHASLSHRPRPRPSPPLLVAKRAGGPRVCRSVRGAPRTAHTATFSRTFAPNPAL